MKKNRYIINDEKVLVANSSDSTLTNISRSQAKDIGRVHIADDVISKKKYLCSYFFILTI